MGKLKPEQVDISSTLDGNEDAYGGRQGLLQEAVIVGDVSAVLGLLARRTNPNNVLGQQSCVAYAMSRATAPLVRTHTAKKAENARAITMALLTHGADLDHRPLDHEGTPSALRDMNVWTDPRFGAQVMLAAMNYALDHGRTPPQLQLETAYRPLPYETPERAADRVALGFQAIAQVQRHVAQQLAQPTDELSARVSQRLPQPQRAWWAQAAAAFGQPITHLKF